MADRKISDLTALTTPASGDYLPIVDISEAAAASKNKRITVEELMRGVPDGTAAAPSIAFESDPNTGIYNPGADQLALSTAGNGRLFIDETGYVGIGTTPTAGYGLDVRGLTRLLTVGGSSGLEIGTGTATNQFASLDLVGDATYTDYGLRILRGNSGANADSNIAHKGTGALSLITEEAAPIVLATANTERLRIDSSGRVGIGTSSPGTTLDVNGDVKLASLNGGPLAGFRNRIINGNFDIWQRGTSFTGNEYGADRWVHARVGTTHTVTRQAFTLGQTEVPGEPTYFCRTVVSSVAGAGNYALLQQKIEDVRTFAGQQITISFWAKVDATKNIAINMVQNFGTGGSPSANVGISGTKVSIGTTFQKVTVTTTIPSISGKTLGTDNNHFLYLNIWFDAGSTYNGDTDSLGQQSGTFDIAQVQIEPGSVATPFERRPIGTELALCQRYFEVLKLDVRRGSSESGQAQWEQTGFRVTKRTSPTFNSGTLVVAVNVTSDTFNDVGVNSFVWRVTPTAVGGYQIQRSAVTASAEL